MLQNAVGMRVQCRPNGMVADVSDETSMLLLVLDTVVRLRADQDGWNRELQAKLDRMVERLDRPGSSQSSSPADSVPLARVQESPGVPVLGPFERGNLGAFRPLQGPGGEPPMLPGGWPPAANGHVVHPFRRDKMQMPAAIGAPNGNVAPFCRPMDLEPASAFPPATFGEPPQLIGTELNHAAELDDSHCYEDAFASSFSDGRSIAWGSKESPPDSSNTSLRRSVATRITGRFWAEESVRPYDGETCILAARKQEVEGSYSRLRRFTKSTFFDATVTLVVILNAMVIGYQTQVISKRVEDSFYARAAYSETSPRRFVVVQGFFTFLFVVDVTLRLIAEGPIGYVSHSVEWAWNVFDLFAVIMGVVDLALEILNSGANFGGVAAVRVLRILRLVRVLKVTRTFSIFRELRMMVESCLNGLRSYFWCFAVIFLMLYIFGVTITTHTYLHVVDSGMYSDDVPLRALHTSFGTLDKSMLSLFQSITGGRDWHDFYTEIRLLGPFDLLLFWVFVSFAIIAMMNAVAAVFVESAMRVNSDPDRAIKEQLDIAAEYRRQIMKLFREMDTNGTGTVTEKEFKQHLGDPRAAAYFNTLQLDVHDAGAIFTLLDADGSGSISYEEFLEGCENLKGNSRSVDMKFLRFELDNVKRNLSILTQQQKELQPPMASFDEC